MNKIPEAFPELFSRIDIHGQIVERDFGVEVNRFSEVLRELLIKEQEYSERIDVTSHSNHYSSLTLSQKIASFLPNTRLSFRSSSTHKLKIKTNQEGHS